MLVRSRVLKNTEIKEKLFKMTIESKAVIERALAGQFIYIRGNDQLAPLLRRPISICQINKEEGTFDIIYQVKKQGTEILSYKKKGDIVNFMGPIGSSFDMNTKYNNIIVIGGGIGIFPLLCLVNQSPAERKSAYLGFKDKKSIVLKKDFSEVSHLKIATDDGSVGYKGFITNLLEADIKEDKPDIIYACGPLSMIEKVVSIAKANNILCQVSMEQRMACGVGACLGCAIKIKDVEKGWVYKHVCKNGPVFWGDEVIFDE